MTKISFFIGIFMAIVIGLSINNNNCHAQIEFNSNLAYGSLTDSRDGQVYKTIKLGSQEWLAQNMNYSTSNGSWCYNDSIQYCEVYGKLYNWEAAKTVCPSGWHLPGADEWSVLTAFLG